jgi:hypothetical protein
MNPSIELLKEIIETIEKIYGNSGYMQIILYAANENGTQNWYWKAKKLIAEYEK